MAEELLAQRWCRGAFTDGDQAEEEARRVECGRGMALVQCNELESCLISVALGIKLAQGMRHEAQQKL